MEFFLIVGAICIVLGGLLFPFHKRVGAQKFHAFGFLILGIGMVIAPFALGMASFADWGIPLENWIMIILTLLLITFLAFAIWFFKARNMPKFLVTGGISVVIAIALFSMIFIFSPKYDVEAEVIAAAQISVKSQLKAPSTAKFSASKDTKVTDLGDNTYLVRGWVEAQNSFGVPIRSAFEVKVTFDDGVSTIIYCRID